MKIILILIMSIMSVSSYSQDQVAEEVKTETSPENRNFVVRWWENTRNNFSDIYHEGKNDFYLTLYAYHDRWTYTPEKLKDLNEAAYGLGFGKSKVNENGNTEMLYLMAHLDSHSDVQVNLGYAWVKKFKIAGDFKLGIGYTALLVSRTDFAHRFPLPIALPMATVDVGDFSLNATLIPKLNDGINNGNVLFIFGRYTWESKK